VIDRKQIEDVILHEVVKLLEEEKVEKVDIGPDSVLVGSGLDSLAFAVLVTRLEEELGYDPFLALEDEIFPRTVAELVEVYATHQPETTSS
jgi:acyl carrier protein